MLIAANVTARNPSIFDRDILLPSKELKDAMIAPTIITGKLHWLQTLKVCAGMV